MKIKYLDRFSIQAMREKYAMLSFSFDLASDSGVSVIGLDKDLNIMEIQYFVITWGRKINKFTDMYNLYHEIGIEQNDIVFIEQMNHTRNMKAVRSLIKRQRDLELYLIENDIDFHYLEPNTILTTLKRYSGYTLTMKTPKDKKKEMTQNYITELMEGSGNPIQVSSKKQLEDVCDAIILNITGIDRIKDGKIKL